MAPPKTLFTTNRGSTTQNTEINNDFETKAFTLEQHLTTSPKIVSPSHRTQFETRSLQLNDNIYGLPFNTNLYGHFPSRKVSPNKGK